MDEQPIARTGYNINWDEIDENSNPFTSSSAIGGNKLPSSPVLHPKEEPNGLKSNVDIQPDIPAVVPPPVVNDSKRKIVSPPIRKSSLSQKITNGEAENVPLASIKNNVPNDHDQFNVTDMPAPDDVSDAVNPITGEQDEGKHDNNLDMLASGNTGVANTRRLSSSSAATFVLSPGNHDDEGDYADDNDNQYLPPDEELIYLRKKKTRLETLVADMQRCINEYEISLRQMAEEKARAAETAKESVIDIISERDQAVEEISTIEKAFGDLHGRFEKSKQIIEKLKQNEEVLKKSAEDYHSQMKRQEQKYQALKAHAEQKLMKVAEETELVKRKSEDELTTMRAAIKRSEVRLHALEAQLEQKVRENTELTKICDELLSKYGNKQ